MTEFLAAIGGAFLFFFILGSIFFVISQIQNFYIEHKTMKFEIEQLRIKVENAKSNELLLANSFDEIARVVNHNKEVTDQVIKRVDELEAVIFIDEKEDTENVE